MSFYFFTLTVGLVAGALSGVIGTGSSILLLPVLVWQFGPKQAVPIMAIAALMANVAKAMTWWREIDWRACAAYAIPGIPAAAMGARALLVLSTPVVDVALGVFFFAMIPARHWLKAHRFTIRLWQLALAGAVIGFVTGIVLSTGPLSVPAFTAYGLTRGAFLSTEAAASLALMVTKVATFRELGALPAPAIVAGLVIGSSVMVGSFLAKRLVVRMRVEAFERILDVVLLAAGMFLLAQAVQ